MTRSYVHGHGAREHRRLQDQAGALVEIVHGGIAFPRGSAVLEVGCGVGAQTCTLAVRSPGARFTCIDVSAESLRRAAERVRAAGLRNVELRQADAMALPFGAGTFDHAFVCFVLEHLRDPVAALAAVRRVLRPGGTITVVEGDHGLTAFHPDHPAAHAAIDCQVRLQARAGGNALIGRQLYPLLRAAGFREVRAEPRMVYVDGSRPRLADAFTRKTFTAMIQGVRAPALEAGLLEPETFDAGVRALERAAEPDGVFCYTFFRAVGVRQRGTRSGARAPSGRARGGPRGARSGRGG
jgi:SAM-dependent methyltransferase